MKPTILVLGSCNIDWSITSDRWPAPGETITVRGIRSGLGGKGANAALAAAKLGGAVRFAGCVGRDPAGDRVRDMLAGHGIDVEQLADCDEATGTAVIRIDPDSGENSIMIDAGANARVTAPAAGAWYDGARVLMLQLETPVAASIEAARRARDAGASVLLDPAPAVADLSPELLGLADFLLPNESELATLTGRPAGSLEEIEAAAKVLADRAGDATVVVTLGRRGALWVDGAASRRLDAPTVQVVDSTAAGDAFAGALALGVAEGWEVEASIRRGLAAGSLACTRPGAQASIADQQELQAFMMQQG